MDFFCERYVHRFISFGPGNIILTIRNFELENVAKLGKILTNKDPIDE
jgi:hypothetical protein